MLQVKKFSGSVKEILPLADIYMRSYNELSKQYKSDEEMKLYTKGSFIKKLKNWAEKQKQGEEPFIFVLYNDEKICGVMRFNKIPSDYRNINNLEASETEHGILDGWTISRKRKIQYLEDPQYTENTLILNQIYLAPEAQKKGWGSSFMKMVIPTLQEKGFEQFIVEYNDNNANGKRFHEDVLCAKKIATTTDFDHIIETNNGHSEFCISPVSIGISNFSKVLEKIEAKEKLFKAKKCQTKQ